MAKKENYGELAATELVKRIAVSRKQLFDLKMKNALGQLRQTSDILKSRREIARLMSFLGKKRLQIKTDGIKEQ